MRYLVFFWAMTLSTLSISQSTTEPYLLCKSHHSSHINEGCMVVDRTGKRLTPTLFDTPDMKPHDGMLRTVKRVPDEHGGEWLYGYITTQGKVVMPEVLRKKDNLSAPTSPQSRRFTNQNELNGFSDGLALVCHREHGCGYIDTNGHWAIPARSDWVEAHDFHHGLALVRGPGYMTDTGPMSSIGPQHIKPPWSVIDKSGRVVMGYDPATEKKRMPSQEELLRQRRFDLFSPPEINIQGDFADGHAVFSQIVPTKRGHDTAYGMVNTKGQIVVAASIKYSREENLRAAYFPKENRKPSAALQKKFYIVSDFHEGLALAIKSHWVDRYGSHQFSGSGFIDRQGRWVIAPRQQLDLEVPFRDGYAVVRIDEPEFGQSHALMDRTGRIVASYRKLTSHPATNQVAP